MLAMTVDAPVAALPTTADSGIIAERPWLTLGVTGYRSARLGHDNLPAITAHIAQTPDAIARAAATLTPVPRLRLVSSLADGGDTIVALQAVALGWQLLAALPLPRATYRADFATANDVAAYEHLLASAEAVFELPGQHSSAELATPHDRAGAYECAGRVVLDQCDVLIAVWDRDPVVRRGGTAQIVAEAVVRDIPVIHIDPLESRPPALLWDGLTDHDLGHQTVETVPKAGLEALPTLFGALLPPQL